MATNNQQPNMPLPNETREMFMSRAIRTFMASGHSQQSAQNTASSIWNNYSVKQSQQQSIRVSAVNNTPASYAPPPIRHTLPTSSYASTPSPTQKSPEQIRQTRITSSSTPSTYFNKPVQSSPSIPQITVPADYRGAGKTDFLDKEFKDYQATQDRYLKILNNRVVKTLNMAALPGFFIRESMDPSSKLHQLYSGGLKRGVASNKIKEGYDALSQKLPGLGLDKYSAVPGKLGTAAEVGNVALGRSLQIAPGLMQSLILGKRAREGVHFKKNADDYGTAGVLHRGLNTANLAKGLISAPIAAALPFGLKGLSLTKGLTGLGSAVGLSGGAATTAALGALILPSVLSMFTKHFAMKHKMKTRGVRLTGDNKKFDTLPGFDSAFQQAMQGDRPLSPYESISLTLLRAIQLNTGSLADTNAIIHHYVENAAQKDVPKSIEDYENQIDNAQDNAKFKGFKYRLSGLGRGIEKGVLGFSQKYNPFHQLGTFLLTGKTPRGEAADIQEAFNDRKNAKLKHEWIEKEIAKTGLSYSALSLMTTQGSRIASYAESPQGKMVNLLTGIFDLTRYHLRVSSNIASQGFGITNYNSAPKIDVKKQGLIHLIPGISALVNIIGGITKVGFKTYKTITEAPQMLVSGVQKLGSGIVTKVNDWISGPISKYSKDPKELLDKALEGRRLSPDQLKEKLSTELIPNKLGEITTLQQTQLDVLYNIWEVNRDILTATTGTTKDYTNKLEIKDQVLDKLTGKYVSSDELEKETKTREKLIRDQLYKDLKVSFGKNLIKSLFNTDYGLGKSLYGSSIMLDKGLSKLRLGASRKLSSINSTYFGNIPNLSEVDIVQQALNSYINPYQVENEQERIKRQRSKIQKHINREIFRSKSPGQDKKRIVQDAYQTYGVPEFKLTRPEFTAKDYSPTFSSFNDVSKLSHQKVELIGVSQDFFAHHPIPVIFSGMSSSGPGQLTLPFGTAPEEADKYHGRGKIDTIGHELKQLEEKKEKKKDDVYKDKQINLLTDISKNIKPIKSIEVGKETKKEDGSALLSTLGGIFTGLGGLLMPLAGIAAAVGGIALGFKALKEDFASFFKTAAAHASAMKGAEQGLAEGSKLAKLSKFAKGGLDVFKNISNKVSTTAPKAMETLSDFGKAQLDKFKASKFGQAIVNKYESAVNAGKKVADTVSKAASAVKTKVLGLADFTKGCREALGSLFKKVLEPLKKILDIIKKEQVLSKVLHLFRKIGDVVFEVLKKIENFKLLKFPIGKWFIRTFYLGPIIKDSWDLYRSIKDESSSALIITLNAISLLSSLAMVPTIALTLGSISFGTLPLILIGAGLAAEWWLEKLQNTNELTEQEKKELEKQNSEVNKLKEDFKNIDVKKKQDQKIALETNTPASYTSIPKLDIETKDQIKTKSTAQSRAENYFSAMFGKAAPELHTTPKETKDPKDTGQPIESNLPRKTSSLSFSNSDGQLITSLQSMNLSLSDITRNVQMIFSSVYKIETIQEWLQDRYRRQDELAVRDRDRQLLKDSNKVLDKSSISQASVVPGSLLSALFNGGPKEAISNIKEKAKEVGRKTGILSPKIIDPNDLGALSALSESGNRSDIIGWDKMGGASYGKYQIANKPGTLKSFLDYAKQNNPEVYDQLSKYTDYDDKSGQFAQTWKQLAKDNKIQDLEHQFIKSTHYDKTYQQLNPDLAKLVDSDKTLQQVMWSMSTAFGPRGAARHFNRNFENISSEGLVNKRQYIESLYGSAMQNYTKEKQGPKVYAGLENRWLNKEKLAALENFDMRSGEAGFNFPTNIQVVTSPMGPRNITHGSKNHKGIDLRGAAGDPVRAMMDGEVISSKSGWLSIKQSDGMVVNYGHMPDAKLKPGDKIKAGQQLSVVGNVGTKTPHLHLEVHDSQGPVNPDDYFKYKMGASYSPKYAFKDSEKRNKLASQIGGRPQFQPNEVMPPAAGSVPTGALQTDAIAGSPAKSSDDQNALAEEFRSLAKVLTASMKQANTPMIGTNVTHQPGRLKDLSTNYSELSDVSKLYEEQDRLEKRQIDKQAAMPTFIPMQTQPIIANPNMNHSSAGHVQDRPMDPISRKIVESIFQNTITSFQQSVQNFALGQTPFAVYR